MQNKLFLTYLLSNSLKKLATFANEESGTVLNYMKVVQSVSYLSNNKLCSFRAIFPNSFNHGVLFSFLYLQIKYTILISSVKDEIVWMEKCQILVSYGTVPSIIVQ